MTGHRLKFRQNVLCTAMDWQPKHVRGKPEFPVYTPRFQPETFSRHHQHTVHFRNMATPAQVYSDVSRDAYMAHLKTALTKLLCDKTIQFRWRPSKDKPSFSAPFLQIFLARKYGPVEVIYQLASNSCLVVFKNAESAFALGRDVNPGHPYGRLYTRRWNPLLQDDNYYKVLKHVETSADTNARYNQLMDQLDKHCFLSRKQRYSWAMSFRNKTYGPAMGPVLQQGKEVQDVFNVISLPKIVKPKPRSDTPSMASETPKVNDVKVSPSTESYVDFMKSIQDLPMAVVKFYATWCAPCKAIAPQVDQLSRENPDVAFIPVDVEDKSSTVDRLNVSVLPTFQFYLYGRLVDELLGSDVGALKEKLSALKQQAEMELIEDNE